MIFQYDVLHIGTQLRIELHYDIDQDYVDARPLKQRAKFYILRVMTRSLSYKKDTQYQQLLTWTTKMYINTKENKENWFYLLSHKRGKCIGINGYVALDHSWNCAPMKVVPYNMVNLFGECAYKASNTHVYFETCGRVKRMEMDKYDIKDVIGQTYLEDISEIRTHGVQFASKVKTNHFERIYDILGHGLLYVGSNEDLTIQDVPPYLANNFVSICANGTTIIFCDGRICGWYELESKKINKALGDSIVSLIGCDTAFIYGINRYGSYVKYNRQTKKFISFKKTLTPSTIISASNVSLQKLYDAMTGEQILDDLDMSMTFYGITALDGNYKLYWTRHPYCGALYAQTNSSSLGTCKQIKKLCPEIKSGYFWLRDATDRLNINKFYCDMETDSGGWFLLFNHTGGKKQTLQKPDLYIKNYPSDILWRGDIEGFRKKYPFSQLRFYCRADHPNRTFHIRTLNINSGPLVADYFVPSLSTGPKACGSFERYADDNSVLANNCFHWGSHGLDGNENSAYGDGSRDSGEMLESFIYISNQERFRYNVHRKDGLCDESYNPGNKGVWRIFVQ